MNRRNFIHALIRIGILTVIAIFVGIFASKGKITRPGECVSGFQCNGCSSINNCKLPESKKFRNNVRR